MMSQLRKYAAALLFLSGCLLPVLRAEAQPEKLEPISFGDMDKWMVREIKESLIIGGNTKYIYEITSGDTMHKNIPYRNIISPWATSSVLAKVMGVVKTSITVFPETRGGGSCARLETRMEHCKVLGLFDISVLASGTIFLGEMREPISDTKNPQSKLISGIPYKKHPKALEYDYKVTTGGKRIRATGFSKQQDVAGNDMAETVLLLQYRWEDEKGHVYAKRIGTAWEQYTRNVTEWHNGHRLTVYYGDITSLPSYRPYMGLIHGDQSFYTRNSKGKVVPIQEVGWGTYDQEVTHLVLSISSSNGGPYVGSPDSKFWVDNIKLVH